MLFSFVDYGVLLVICFTYQELFGAWRQATSCGF